MKKAIDVNERTLEKDKKDFITVCKSGEVFSVLFMVICIVGILSACFMSVVYILSIAIDTEFATSHVIEEIFCMVNNILIMLGVIITCNIAFKIFSRLKADETPFRKDIADMIKKAGKVLIITGAFGCITEFIYGILKGTAVFTSAETLGIISGNEDLAIMGAIIIAVAYIFNYGCKLQQESDETL